MATRTPSLLAAELRATIKGELAQGFSTRVLAATFSHPDRTSSLSETSIRDIASGRRGVSDAKARAALANYTENRKGVPVEIVGGGRAMIRPRNRTEAVLIGKYGRAIRAAKETGDWRHVRAVMGGKTTFYSFEGKRPRKVKVLTSAKRLRELDDAAPIDFAGVTFISPPKRSSRPRRRR